MNIVPNNLSVPLLTLTVFLIYQMISVILPMTLNDWNFVQKRDPQNPSITITVVLSRTLLNESVFLIPQIMRKMIKLTSIMTGFLSIVLFFRRLMSLDSIFFSRIRLLIGLFSPFFPFLLTLYKSWIVLFSYEQLQ